MINFFPLILLGLNGSPKPHLAEWLGGRPSGQWTEVRNPLAGVELLAAAMSDPRE